jgi:hypothetical protein
MSGHSVLPLLLLTWYFSHWHRHILLDEYRINDVNERLSSGLPRSVRVQSAPKIIDMVLGNYPAPMATSNKST